MVSKTNMILKVFGLKEFSQGSDKPSFMDGSRSPAGNGDLFMLPIGQGRSPEEAHTAHENWPLRSGNVTKVEALQERPDEHTCLEKEMIL